MNNQDDVASVASKTYRCATKKLAKVIGVTPIHTRYPSEDFENMLDKADNTTVNRALEWYERGIKRGILHTKHMVLNGTLAITKQRITIPKTIEVNVRVKFKNRRWQKRSFKFKAADIGFD